MKNIHNQSKKAVALSATLLVFMCKRHERRNLIYGGQGDPLPGETVSASEAPVSAPLRARAHTQTQFSLFM